MKLRSAGSLTLALWVGAAGSLSGCRDPAVPVSQPDAGHQTDFGADDMSLSDAGTDDMSRPDIGPGIFFSGGSLHQLPADAEIVAVAPDESRIALTSNGGSTLLMVDLESLTVDVVTDSLVGVPEVLDLTIIRFTPQGALVFPESGGDGSAVPRVFNQRSIAMLETGGRRHNWPILLGQDVAVELVFEGDDDVLVRNVDTGAVRLVQRVSPQSDISIFPGGILQSPGVGGTRYRNPENFALEFSEGRPVRVLSPDGPIDLPEVASQSWEVSPSPRTWCGWADDAAYRFDLLTGELTATAGRILGGVRVLRECLSYIDVGGATELLVIDGSNSIESRMVSTVVVEPRFDSSPFEGVASERALDLIAVEGRQIVVEGLPNDVGVFEFGRVSQTSEGIVAIRFPIAAGGNGSELWRFDLDGGFEVLRTDPPPAFTADPCERVPDGPYVSLATRDTTASPLLVCQRSVQGPQFTSLGLLDPLTNTNRSLEGRELRLQHPLTFSTSSGVKVWRSRSNVFVLEGPNENGELDLLQFELER